MTVTKRDLQIIIPFILFVGIGIYGAFSVDFIMREITMATTLKWCGVPTFILAVYYAYRGTFGYPNEVAIWRNTLGMIGMTAACCIMFFMAFQGFLILYNCHIGQQNDYLLQGQITKIDSVKNKSGRISYSLKLYREHEKDTIKLDLPKNEFSEGQFFSKQMKVGSLGFIYDNE